MKKGLLIVIILMCVAALMAAMAYSSATITNASTLTITNSNTGLLALIPKDTGGIGNKDGTAFIDAQGKLSFNFDKVQAEILVYKEAAPINGTHYSLRKTTPMKPFPLK